MREMMIAKPPIIPNFNTQKRAAMRKQWATLVCLATDPRMKAAYRELGKQKRDSSYQHVASLYHNGNFNYKTQDDLIAAFVILASNLSGHPFISKQEIKSRRAELRDLQQRVAAVANWQWYAHTSVREDALQKAAHEFVNVANRVVDTIGAAEVAPAQPRSPRVDVTVYLRRLAHFSKEFFGSPLYGVMATIANVALKRDDISEATVRGTLQR